MGEQLPLDFPSRLVQGSETGLPFADKMHNLILFFHRLNRHSLTG
jgi:hypothetical protein